MGLLLVTGSLCTMPLFSTSHAMASSGAIYLGVLAGAPGTSVPVMGYGFPAGSHVNLYWNGNPTGFATASSAGSFQLRLTVPSNAPQGFNTVTAQALLGALSVASFTVTGGSTPPPVVPPAPVTPPTQSPQPVAPPSGSSGGSTSTGCSITSEDQAGEQYLLSLLNQHRAAAGAPPLVLSSTLSVASRQHSCDMFQHQTMSHTGSDGSSPFQRIAAVGISYSTAGENIGMAGGYSLDAGINAIDSGMMAEPNNPGTHHWNIVNAAYKQVGLGVIYQNGQVWLTEDFVG